MPIVDMGQLQDQLNKMAEAKFTHIDDITGACMVVQTQALVSIAEQLHEVNGYLAAISKAMEKPKEEQVYARTPKQCVNCRFFDMNMFAEPCVSCAEHSLWEPKDASNKA